MVETGEMQAIFQRIHPGHLLSRESDKTRERRVKRAKRRPKNRQNNKKNVICKTIFTKRNVIIVYIKVENNDEPLALVCDRNLTRKEKVTNKPIYVTKICKMSLPLLVVVIIARWRVVLSTQMYKII
jgi:hypothetical protein